MGFLADLTSYWWNWGVWHRTFASLWYCWAIGVLGLVFDDDDGYMTNQCYKLMGGLAVTFPVEYKSVYEDDTS
tara:strand:+ start:74 stop:292 length:219 start_codon:yes stop_codon:yes gene_type:complete